MFLLQILNETDTEPEEAIVEVQVRLGRIEVEEVRVVVIVLRGRPIEALALQDAHSRAVAAARGRQKDCTCSLDF